MVGVNPFIVLRCTTPLLVSVFDWLFLERELPRGTSLLSLLGIFFSGSAYALLDGLPTTEKIYVGESSLWGLLWLVSFIMDMIYIKHVVDKHECSGLERTIYQNALALPFWRRSLSALLRQLTQFHLCNEHLLLAMLRFSLAV